MRSPLQRPTPAKVSSLGALAPTLSKLAVGDSIRRTCVGSDIDYVGNDTENKAVERAAASVVRVFRRLHSALSATSWPQTEKATQEAG